MNIDQFAFDICDDWIACRIDDLSDVHAASHAIRSNRTWSEVVGGIDSLAVQFDPLLVSPDEALEKLKSELTEVERATGDDLPSIQIPICYNRQFAPDLDLVVEALDISIDDFPDWHSNMKMKVTMMGFMPGFSYLISDANIPDIGRLPQPRQKVLAGSVGLTGCQSCIYSFDSPGGWPLVGRTPMRLFVSDGEQPALLQPGQEVCFKPITVEEFDSLAADHSA